jgi:VWFA-related protein
MGKNMLQFPAGILRLNLVRPGAIAFLILACGAIAAPQADDAPEVLVHGTVPKFRLRTERNLVLVRVVVRDAKERTVGDLHKEEFRLFDDGAPREIKDFTVEAAIPNPTAVGISPSPDKTSNAAAAGPSLAPASQQRFIALFFDDLHVRSERIERARDAAWRFLSTSLQPQDRIAILSSSGEYQLDFTDDRAKLHDTLFRMAPHSHTAAPGRYPEISDYQAYLIDQVHDHDATEIAFGEATQHLCCQPGDTQADIPTNGTGVRSGEAVFAGHCELAAHQSALAEAAEVWTAAKIQSANSLERIRGAVARMGNLPGQRSLVLVSTGFVTETREAQLDAIVDQALRESVVISALDAEGLSALTPHRLLIPSRPDLSAQKDVLEQEAVNDARQVLAKFSAGTGGVFIRNSDDFDEAFHRVTALPEVYYVLSFSPRDVKLDGKFHSLKVTLNSHEPFTVQARRGYFAAETPPPVQTPGEDNLQQEVFSLEEHHELPAEINAKVEKLNDRKSTLTVSIHVDISSLRYRKEAGRSVNTLIFDTALFDRNGKYLSSKESSLEFHLKDASLVKFSRSGINAKTSFEVEPGTYRIREIVRDSESVAISALNCNAQVPGASY